MGGERWTDGVLGGEHTGCKARLRTGSLQEQEVTGAGGQRSVAGDEREGRWGQAAGWDMVLH